MQKVFAVVSLSQKTVSASSLKNLEKSEKSPFETLRKFVFELKVASKSFPKKLPMTKFWSKKFKHFAYLFQKMVSTSSIINFQKTEKRYFQTPAILVLELKEASKGLSKKIPMTKFW